MTNDQNTRVQTERERLITALLHSLARTIRHEDVHASAVERLADAVTGGTMTYTEAHLRLAGMKCPRSIRTQVEKTCTDIEQVMALTPADADAIDTLGLHPDGLPIAVAHIRHGDVVQLPGSTVRRTVASNVWPSEGSYHVITFDGDDATYTWPSAGAPAVVLVDRPGYGPFDEQYAVGDRVHVWVRCGRDRDELGVVQSVHHYPEVHPGYTIYEVRYVHGTQPFGPENMRREPTAAPQVGQKWISKTGRTLATVTAVDPMSPEVSTDVGTILLGGPYWMPVDPANPWTVTEAALCEAAEARA